MPPPRRSALASPSDSFAEKKAKILSQLAVPDAEYTDLSPKGSVDEGIRDLIAEINEIDGLVTTSSCAGRVSVFLEGVKKEDGGKDGQVAAVGGKGAGGAWLFVSHDPVHDGQEETRDWKRIFGLSEETFEGDTSGARRFIHFKFEPLILHIYTATPQHAQLVLRCALTAGFRESGALNIIPATSSTSETTPMVGIRSMGLGFESLIGVQQGSRRDCLVTAEYLTQLAQIGNERFRENTARIERFRRALKEAMSPESTAGVGEWEDANTRRERKRAEGLRRKAEMQAAEQETGLVEENSIEVPW